MNFKQRRDQATNNKKNCWQDKSKKELIAVQLQLSSSARAYQEHYRRLPAERIFKSIAQNDEQQKQTK